MEIVIGGAASLRTIDRLYQESPQKFSNSAQGPEYIEMLHKAALQLSRNWPTEQQSNSLQAFIKQLRNNLISGHERIAFEGINTANALGYREEYTNSSGDSAADVKLFVSLYNSRPEGQVFEELASISEVESIVKSISLIKKR